MNGEDQIAWVQLTLNFPPEQEAWLEKVAQAAGLSIKCYCLHGIYKHLLQDASGEQAARWQAQFPITLRRNGCHEGVPSGGGGVTLQR